MKITIEELNQIIREEIEDELIKEKDKKKPKINKRKECAGTPGNWAHRASDGRFSNKSTANCHSKYLSCPEGGRSRSKAGSNKRLAISNPAKSGRRPDREYKCSTNKKLKKETILTKSELERIIREEILACNLDEIMPKKPDWEKRKNRRAYDDEQSRQNRHDLKTGRDSLQRELDKIRKPFKRMANGIFQEDSIIGGADDDDQEKIQIKLIALEALRDALAEIEAINIEESNQDDPHDQEQAHLDSLYKFHKNKADKRKKLAALKKQLCKPCPKGATVGGLANQINQVALALKAKLKDPPKKG